jgi:hypothetical protein
MVNPVDLEHLENECLWCQAPCEKYFCCEQCAKNWIQE